MAALERITQPAALAAAARLSMHYAACTLQSASYLALAADAAPPACMPVSQLRRTGTRADESVRAMRWRIATQRRLDVAAAFADAMRNGNYAAARWLYQRYGAAALASFTNRSDVLTQPAAAGDIEMLAWLCDVVGVEATHVTVATACAGGHAAAAYVLQQRHALAPLEPPGTNAAAPFRSHLVRVLCSRTLDSDEHAATLVWFCDTYLGGDGSNVGGELLFTELAERRLFASLRALLTHCRVMVPSPKCATIAALAAIAAGCSRTLAASIRLLDAERDAALVGECMLRAAASGAGAALRMLVDAFCARDLSHPTRRLAPRDAPARARPAARPTLLERLVAAACRAASADAVGVLLASFHVPPATLADGARIACAYAAHDVYALLAPRCGACTCRDKDCLGQVQRGADKRIGRIAATMTV
jgi:hypothetical protein